MHLRFSIETRAYRMYFTVVSSADVQYTLYLQECLYIIHLQSRWLCLLRCSSTEEVVSVCSYVHVSAGKLLICQALSFCYFLV
jgi:hypothetical protein